MSSGSTQSFEFAKAEIFTASSELFPLRKTGLARFYDDRWKMHLSSGYYIFGLVRGIRVDELFLPSYFNYFIS